MRTHTCNQLRLDKAGQTATLAGWVNSYRDHGGVIFIDLRDRAGITQVVFHPEHQGAHKLAETLRHEDVIQVSGKVVQRAAGMENSNIATGEIEIVAEQLNLLNKSQTPPFLPENVTKVGEEIRLKHRYIDLRRPSMQNILATRHKTTKIIRDFFDKHGFYEIETPFLCRSTPEGARDFLVPSRLQPGEFYALPQSPQLFKQILMVSGVEKYMQIVRCFRDEDPRADRQAEFTQLDVEMSFVEPQEVMSLCEDLIRQLWKDILDIEIGDIPHMTYDHAVNQYGSDRPDLRFGMELVDISSIASNTDFKVFTNAINSGGAVKAIRVPGGAKMSRKETDALAEWCKQFGAGGLPVTKVEGGKLATGIAKFLAPITDELIQKMEALDGDLICFGVDSKLATVNRVLGELRVKLAGDLNMIEPGQWKWVWVVDFPLVEWDGQAKRWHSLHHPFTAPNDEDLDKLETDTANVKSKAYDLVLNGSELGGGSIRIHQSDLQQRVLKLLGIDEKAAQEKFGFLLDALKYGAPPHGGIAFGIDRVVMHLCHTSNIRDVIAFPKTQNGADLMTQAPSVVDQEQLKELSLRLMETAAPLQS